MRFAKTFWMGCLAMALGSGCGRSETPVTQAQDSEPGTEVRDPSAGLSLQAEAPAAVPPREYYHDLTVFDWYRRGEAIVIDGRALRPSGRPVPTGGHTLDMAGEFGGVTFYVPAGTPPPYGVVYVPVAPGYWQPFGQSERSAR